MFHVKQNRNIYATIGTTAKREGKFMDITNRIDALIEDGDISITELAFKIGVSRQQIARWRKGTSEPGASNLRAICDIYHVSADYILGLPKGLSWPR